MRTLLRTALVALATLLSLSVNAATPPAAAAPAAAPVAAAPAAPVSGAARTLDRADVEAWLDGFMPYAIRRGNIAGAVVTVVKDGEVLVAKGYGYADVEAKKPVDPATTMFRPGSVSKLLTWTAVMQQVERGKLDLDTDVNKYLDFKIPERPDGPITLRHIMTHTPGFEEQIKSLITDDPSLLVPLGTYARNSTPTRIYKAGTTPAYSNYATALAGYLVERTSGMSFDDYLDANIFRPLGMAHSTFRQPLPAQFEADMAKGYKVATEKAKPFEIVVPAPAGSLSASGVDMAHFMIAHLQNGEFGGNRILSEATARMMHETATTMIPPLNRMMLGFYEQNYNGHRVISHGGDTSFMHSYLHLFLDDNVGLYVSVNSAGKEGAAGAVRSALFEQFADRYFPAAPGPAEPTLQTAAEHARLVAGQYEVSRRPDRSFMSLLNLLGALKVTANDDGTITASMLRGLNGEPKRFREVEPFVWRDTASNWRAAAKIENGRVLRLSEDELSPFMVFEPIPMYRSPVWLLPAAAIAAAACLLTALFWPIGAIVRWRLRAPLRLAGDAARAHRGTRMGATLVAVVVAAWAGVLVGAMSKMSLLSPAFDKWIIVLSAVSVIGFVGGAALLLLAAVRTWRSGRPWYSRLWAIVLAASGLVLLYAAWLSKLMSFVTKY
jgi:CubicO group peptidase (beta-lactamase class C family)